MPTYLYRRQDGTTFEIEQRITAPRLTECPTTGQPVERLISGSAGLVFKGSGFYQTDYARKNAGVSSGSGSESGSGGGSGAESGSGGDSGSGTASDTNGKPESGAKAESSSRESKKTPETGSTR